MKNVFAGLIAFVVAFVGMAYAVESVNLKDVKCLLNDSAAAKEDKNSDWKDGKVYFCCNSCQGKFNADKKAFASKANYQLVATKQVEQKLCPYSGGDINKDQKIEVKGATVAFCCGNCKAKAEKVADDKKVDELFSEEKFTKAKFTKVTAK